MRSTSSAPSRAKKAAATKVEKPAKRSLLAFETDRETIVRLREIALHRDITLRALMSEIVGSYIAKQDSRK